MFFLSVDSRTNPVDFTFSPESMNPTTTEDDSDLEADVNSLPNLSDFIPADILQALYQSREWKLQTTINELIHTERTHLKGLKIMKKCFREPMERSPSMSPVELDCIFRNLDQLIDLHSKNFIELRLTISLSLSVFVKANSNMPFGNIEKKRKIMSFGRLEI